jgi:hypothetical protein
MNKNLLMAFLFCLTSSIANASEVIETTKPIICGPTQAVLDELKQDKENPIFMGESMAGESGYIVFFNEKTKTFTVVQFNEKIMCILGVGKEGKLIFKGI